MTDLHGLQRQALRERRRQALYFITIIVVVVLSMGLGWISSVSEREAWKQRAETWQSDPAGSPGPAGPQGQGGPRGPAGPLCPDNYAAQELVLQDGRTALVCILTPVR